MGKLWKVEKSSINHKNYQISRKSKRSWVDVLGAYIEDHKREAEKLEIKHIQTESPFSMGQFQVVRQARINNNGIKIYDTE